MMEFTWQRRLRSREWLLGLVALFMPGQRVAGDGQVLFGHSITSPPDVRSLAADWFLGGTVIPSHRGLVLSPGVPGRVGVLWSHTPLLTNNFEVTLTLTATGPEKRTVADDGFAFWYVYENGADAQANITIEHAQNQQEIIELSWRNHFTSQGYDLFGYRSLYDGLGVFFVDDEETTVSALSNNGRMPYKLRTGVPTSDALKANYRTASEVTVSIRVEPHGAKVLVEGAGTFEVKSDMKPGGYIGITTMSGTQGGGYEPAEKSTRVELTRLTVVNMDAAAQGEEPQTEPPATAPPSEGEEAKEKVDVLHEMSSFQEHRAVSEAIKDLTNTVFRLVMETQPQSRQMLTAIGHMEARVSAMERSFVKLKEQLDQKTGHRLGDEFESIKKELTSLGSSAMSQSKERHARLESLHKDIVDVHSSAQNIDKHLDTLASSNDKVMDSLSAEHHRVFGVSIAAIAFIFIAGLSLYNKFRCWEKKHIL